MSVYDTIEKVCLNRDTQSCSPTIILLLKEQFPTFSFHLEIYDVKRKIILFESWHAL